MAEDVSDGELLRDGNGRAVRPREPQTDTLTANPGSCACVRTIHRTCRTLPVTNGGSPWQFVGVSQHNAELVIITTVTFLGGGICICSELRLVRPAVKL